MSFMEISRVINSLPFIILVFVTGKKFPGPGSK